MSIDQMINSHFKDGINLEVSDEELNVFVKEYLSIQELKDKYKVGECNRKEVGQEILKRMESLTRLMHFFENSLLRGKDDYYKYPDPIRDYEKVFELLLRLSNKEKEEYRLYDIYRIFDKLHVIAKTDAFKGIDLRDDEVVYGALFSKVISAGYSMVLLGGYGYRPYSVPTKVKVHEFSVRHCLIGDFYAYTYDDALGDAVNKLSKYIEKYGGNVENISLETLLSRIEELDQIKETGTQKVISLPKK